MDLDRLSADLTDVKPKTVHHAAVSRRTPLQDDERRYAEWHWQLLQNLYAECGDFSLTSAAWYESIGLVSSSQGTATNMEGVNLMIDLSKVTVTDTAAPKRQTGKNGVDRKDLPILKSWLKDSYAKKTGKLLPVPGKLESVPSKERKTGKVNGTHEKITGDAAAFMTLLRLAAQELNYGLSVRTSQKKADGKDVVVFEFSAQDRRKYSPRNNGQ